MVHRPGNVPNQYSRAVNKAWSSVEKKEDRDTVRSRRSVIVPTPDDVIERHDWILENLSLAEEVEVESEWLQLIIYAHAQIVHQIDLYLNSLSNPSGARSHRSRPR